MGQYLPILALLVLAVLFADVSFLVARGSWRRAAMTPAKVAPYESRHRARP